MTSESKLAMRRTAVNVLASLVFGAVIGAAGHRSVEDLTVVFGEAPRQIVSAGHTQRALAVKSRVPAGSTLYYLMDGRSDWQFGQWQRSLYPGYVLLPIVGLKQLQTNRSRKLRQEYHIEFFISSGSPALRPVSQWQVSLAEYPGENEEILGKLLPE